MLPPGNSGSVPEAPGQCHQLAEEDESPWGVTVTASIHATQHEEFSHHALWWAGDTGSHGMSLKDITS